MKKEPGTLSLQRISVALATPGSRTQSLDAIAGLAAIHGAQVSYVFIEDADMLRAARLPFALEVCRATNVVRRVDSSEIERGLRECAVAIRKLVAETAERAGARWSFEVVRQRTATAILELAKRTDVTVFTAATSLPYQGPVAPEVAKNTDHFPAAGESIVVLVDRSAASGRAVQVAHSLAEMHGIAIHAVVAAGTRPGLDRLNAQLRRTTDLDAAHIQDLYRPEFSDIVAAARARRPAAAVLPITLVKGSSERIRELEDAIDNPILIVK